MALLHVHTEGTAGSSSSWHLMLSRAPSGSTQLMKSTCHALHKSKKALSSDIKGDSNVKGALIVQKEKKL